MKKILLVAFLLLSVVTLAACGKKKRNKQWRSSRFWRHLW